MANDIHVLPARGNWAVQEGDTEQPVSFYTTVTHAERAARERARAVGATSITIHDLYARVRVASVEPPAARR
jgi:hypothetical protein